ncbi:Abi family protein [Rhodococcus sp. As11]|uniref:Abi family protein n=1 Tax=Rhodococcus sp. As11 TaxID=3029189 RepID=UPI003B77B7E0
MLQPKPFLSISEQVDLMQSRGMQIPDREAAERWLHAVGYYRMSGYWHPFWNRNDSGELLEEYVEGTTFDEVVGLYEFDRHLKNRMLSALERIEVAIRSQIGHTLGKRGPLAHLEAANFHPKFVESGDHMAWLATAFGRVKRGRAKDQFVKHHFARYGGQIPIWVLTEVLDFSDLSKLYQGLQDDDRDEIASWFAIEATTPRPRRGTAAHRRRRRSRAEHSAGPGHILANWLEHLTIVRNICAHRARLWNRTLTPFGTPALASMDYFDGLPSDQADKVYGSICISGHLLRTTSPGSTWALQLGSLVHDTFSGFHLRSPLEMGFPENWQQLPLWTTDTTTH